ncbi:PAS domain S-box protein [Geomesophilobacter sediminis]|uniref:histidine kinase n=1 Tax=Geomesophilobacter sediminis TaxID=2798584 RepID=A0A8J7M0Y8_9BACT|nr:PAS domain S-box protein [Geomesophilobacter sediminis]MBJ6726623.1 PAS domain S-box protein [Geomesophilobacter sediminis]
MSEQLKSPNIAFALAAFALAWLAVALLGSVFASPFFLCTFAALLVGVAAFMATLIDSQRRRAEAAWKRAEARCAAVLEAAGDGLCIINGKESLIKGVNARFTEKWGTASPAGKLLSDALRDPELARAAANLLAASSPWAAPVEVEGTDDGPLLTELRCLPLPATGREAADFILVLRDLSLEKRCQKLVEAAREPYRTLLEHVGTAMAVVTPDGKLTLSNQAARELTGYSREEMEGRLLADLADPESQQELVKQWGEPVSETARDAFHIRLRHRNGSEMYVGVERAVIPGSSDLLVSLRDSAAERQLEDELRESRATLALLQRISRMGTWEWDIVNDTISWSEEMYRIFWVDPAQQLPTYEGYLNMVHPGDREQLIQAINNALYNKKPYNLDHRIVLPDGSVRAISGRAEVTYDAKGNPLRMVGTNQDITWRVEAEQALRSSEEKFSKAFHASPDSIVITRADDGTYIDVNEAFQEMTGYTRDEVLGKSSYADLKLWVDPDARMMMLKLMNQFGHVRNLEVRFRVKSGEIKELLWSADVIEYGGEACLIAISRDVTEQRHLEQELLKSEAKLYMKHEELKNLFQQMEGIRREWEETMDCISDLFILSDQWGRIRRFNRAVEEFTGMAHRDIVGRDCLAFLEELGLRSHVENPGVELFHETTGRWFVVKRYAFPHSEADSTTREVVIINDTTDIGRRNEPASTVTLETAPSAPAENLRDIGTLE